MQDRLVKLLKEADENTANKMITDYEDAIKDNAEYLIANGVIVPPCKVGDKIYFVCGYNMAEYEIYKMEYDELFWKFYCQNDTYVIEHREFVCLYPNTSQTIFFSKEEADQALAKMKGGAE